MGAKGTLVSSGDFYKVRKGKQSLVSARLTRKYKDEFLPGLKFLHNSKSSN